MPKRIAASGTSRPFERIDYNGYDDAISVAIVYK